MRLQPLPFGATAPASLSVQGTSFATLLRGISDLSHQYRYTARHPVACITDDEPVRTNKKTPETGFQVAVVVSGGFVAQHNRNPV